MRLEQRREAMANGQGRRLRRAEELRRIRSNEIDAASVIRAPSENLAGMFVFDFLAQVPRIGPEAIRQINARAVCLGVNLAVALGELEGASREWLARTLPKARTGRHPLASRPQG